MTYRQAMKKQCKCGKFLIGGWIGDHKTGRPNFSRVSAPRILYPAVMMSEEHAEVACYSPQHIA